MSSTPSMNWELFEFPCEYNLKVMGYAKYPLKDIISEIVTPQVPDFDPERITFRPSKTGKYHSVTAYMRIDNKDQLVAIYSALAEREEVAWTL